MHAARMNEAMELMVEQRYAEAAPLLAEMHHAFPQDARINYSFGLVHHHFGDYGKALQHLVAASKIATKREEVFVKLAETYNDLLLHNEALEAARRAVALNKASAQAQVTLGHSYYFMQKPVMARQAYLRATESAPNSSFAYFGLYRLENSLGNFKEAAMYLDKAYELDPDNPAILLSAAENSKYQAMPELQEKILSIIDDPDSKIAPDERAKLGLAIGKIFEKNDDLEKAFIYYAKYRKGMYRPYNIKLRKWEVEAVKNVFDKRFFEDRKDYALSSERPVFVFGMPRSGTTMVEQIIGRHPKAVGVGELMFFARVQAGLRQSEDVSPRFFESATKLDQKHAKRIGRKYLAELEAFDKKAARIVDKMPHNFEMLWLLALLFPNAKFVHVHREPADTCASIYTLPFLASHNYNIDQETLGAYYGLYAELMEHWDKTLPMKIRHQSYEALITDLEGESRALLNYVELPWDPSCLDFHKSSSQVLTFSRQQVRQPIYTSSIGRWKKYEPYIQPLLKALGKHAPQSD